MRLTDCTAADEPLPYALPFVVALTGHRDLHPDDVAIVAERLYQAIELVAAALPHTPVHFLTALADGADQLFAQQVLKLQRQCAAQDLPGQRRIELVVPLPMAFEAYCAEQAGGEAARARDPQAFAAARQAYTARFLHHSAGAGKVFVIPNTAPADVLAAPATPAQAAYANLARYLCVHAQLLIAVWDGQPEAAHFPRRPGGTLDLVHTVLHGVERGQHRRSGNRFAAPARGVVLHVYSRRARPSSASLPAACTVDGVGLAHGEHAGDDDAIGYWHAPQADWPGVTAPGITRWLRSPLRACQGWAEHRAWRALLARVQDRLGRACPPHALAVLYRVRASGREIDALNLAHQRALLSQGQGPKQARAQHYAQQWRASAGAFLASLGLTSVAASPASLGLGLGPLLQAYCALDVQAERGKRYWRYRWQLLAAAAMLASASSALRLLSPSHGDLIESLVFALGALCAVGTYLWVALAPQRNAYLDYRALAEGLRFQMYWLCAGEPARVTDHYVQKYSGEIGWLRPALDACLVVHPVAGLPARRVLHGWLTDQLAYLDGDGNRRRRRRHGRAVAIGNHLLLTGLLCSMAALALVLGGGHAALPLALLIAAMKLSAGVGAAWLSLNHKVGHGETLMQADQLRALYGRARQALARLEATAGSDAEQERHAHDLLFALGKAVLDENASWQAAYQQRRLSWHGR